MTKAAIHAIFLDLRKAYDTADRERSLETFSAYGVGPRLCGLIERFWDEQQIVARQAGYHGPAFTASRGYVQGGLLSPEEFNILIDSVLRYWFTLVISDEGVLLDSNELGPTVATRLTIFYADDGILTEVERHWLQAALDILVGLFHRCGLETNASKTKAMTLFPSQTRTMLTNHAYKRRMTGQGEDHRQLKKRRVTCPACGNDLAAASLASHQRRIHGLEPPLDFKINDALLAQHTPHKYQVSFPRHVRVKNCPVPGCSGRSRSRIGLRRHFMHRHPHDNIHILEEHTNPYPKCERCGLQVPWRALMTSHHHTQACLSGTSLRNKRHRALETQRAHEVTFTVEGKVLERVDTFRYLGRMISHTNSDWPAVFRQLTRARQRWAMLVRAIAHDQVPAKAAGMFYKAIVQSVLLYGSETWVVTRPMLQLLEGFHNRVARKLTGRMPYLEGDTWIYPPMKETLEKANMYTVEHYIRVRQAHMEDYVATRPILPTCKAAQQAAGESDRLRWWTQPTQLPARDEDDNTSNPSGASDHDSSMEEFADEAIPMDIDEFWEPDDLVPLPPLQPAMAGRRAGNPGGANLVIDVDVGSDSDANVDAANAAEAQLSPPARPATFRAFTYNEESWIAAALYGDGDNEDTMARVGTDTVSRTSMHTLRPGTWLNDEVIHYMLQMYRQRDEDMDNSAPVWRRSHFFKSFFITSLLQHGNPDATGQYCYRNVRRWGQQVPGGNIFEMDKLFFPINVGRDHWILVVVYMQERRIQCYDSMGSPGTEYVQAIFTYLQDEHETKHGYPMEDMATWRLVACTADTPRQRTGYDCGVFVCTFIDLIAFNTPLSFDQSDLVRCRKRLALSILQGTAMPLGT